MKQIERIYILGTVGSGKTTLAKKLEKKLGIEHYNLDDIYWLERYYKKRGKKDRRRKLHNICKRKKWIIEGVYGTWTKEAIEKSNIIVLLDFPLGVLIWRLIKRFFANKEYLTKTGIKDNLTLIRYAYLYKKSEGSPYGFIWHERLARKSKVDFIIVKSNKELNDFIQSLK